MQYAKNIILIYTIKTKQYIFLDSESGMDSIFQD